MSVLIEGMEMPNTCEDCNLESFCGLWIDARRMVEWTPENHGNPIRHPECPLVPIPEHGRLIDADALDVIGYCGTEGREDTFDDGVIWLAEQIDLLPTIIPASEEEMK